jgi:hypothetical protein
MAGVVEVELTLEIEVLEFVVICVRAIGVIELGCELVTMRESRSALPRSAKRQASGVKSPSSCLRVKAIILAATFEEKGVRTLLTSVC